MATAKLTRGTTFSTKTGEQVTVGKMLGKGGQGIAYHAKFRGKPCVLKVWYPDGTTEQQRKELVANAAIHSPSSAFAWPEAVVVNDVDEVIGYTMPYCGGKSIFSLKDRVEAKCKHASYWSLTRAAINLAKSMVDLHSIGRCYGDLSLDNILFNEQTGRVYLIDTDNVVRANVNSHLIFTFGCAAPELVRKSCYPSTATDCHSLAAAIFTFLVGGQPLDGIRMATSCYPTLDELTKYHGIDPLFIFNANDKRNRPHRVLHKNVSANWNMLPPFMQELFQKAFTDGLAKPSVRIRETKWIDALIELQDMIVVCGHCCGHNYVPTGELRTCWNCKKSVVAKRTLVIDDGVANVALNVGGIMFPHHTTKASARQMDSPVAQVITNPTNPKVWGLKNTGPMEWIVTTTAGKVHRIESGSVSPLSIGTAINFGTRSAVVC